MSMKTKIVGNPRGRYGVQGKGLGHVIDELFPSLADKQKSKEKRIYRNEKPQAEQVDYSEFIDEMEEWGKPDE